jgi:hypothetical protein
MAQEDRKIRRGNHPTPKTFRPSALPVPSLPPTLFCLAALLGLGCTNAPPPRPVVAVAPARHVATPAPAPAPPVAEPEPPKPPPSREERLIAKMLEKVGHARGLAPKKVVPGVTLGRTALIARVKSHVDREVPHDAIVNEGLAQQLLGFIPTRFDYEAATYALLEAQLAGFYEPADGTMYMAADLDDENAFATLAHELVHALQDQYWDLAPKSKYVPGQEDKEDAFSGLAEGDATSAMADVMISQAKPGATALDIPNELFAEQIIGGMSGGPTADAPHVMRMSLVAPYIDGTLFIHALRRKGGWAAVNKAWEHPPETTEQLLHVDKWTAHEPALAVAEPTFAALGAGWSVADADTYGELGVRLALGEWLGTGPAAPLAAGWGGDRGVLVKKGEEYAFAWHVRYDDAKPKAPDAFAERAFLGLGPAIGKIGHPQGARATSSAATLEGFACSERKETGPLAALRKGRDIVIVAGPTKVSPKGWTSMGKCDLARKWATEIAP